jgi:hypothetical protein
MENNENENENERERKGDGENRNGNSNTSEFQFKLRGCLHLRGWIVTQLEKWYPACRMRAIGNGVLFPNKRR